MKSRLTLVCPWVVVAVTVGCANNAPPANRRDASGQAGDPDAAPSGDAGLDQTVDLTDDESAPDASPAARDAPPEAPPHDAGAASEEVAVNPATWSRIYVGLLNNMSYASNCTGEGCHNPGIQKNLDLSTPENGYVSVQGKLMPGNPDGSIIVYELQTGMMPRGRPRMPAADVELIKAWILGGAAND